ncbi:MAG: NADPH:quinone oxidoreductase family protein [Actinomycetota bacterium]
MKSLVVNQLGSLDDLHVQETDSPPLTDGQVRIKVAACGLNFVDSLLVEGRYQVKPAVPFVPGSEITGRIVETGPGVDVSMTGRRVFAPVPNGGFADEVVTAANRVLPIPDALTDGQGATFMQSYLTAWFAFTRRTQVQAGRTMLVLGAGGGIGLAAVDAGVALGLRVIAGASSEEKRQLALDRGAFAAVDVLNDDVKARVRELAGGGVDIVYDPVGGDLAEPCLRALNAGGEYMVVGFVAGIPRLPANFVLLLNRTVVGVDWGAWVGRNQAENQKMLVEVMGRIVDGSLRPVEPVAYPMSRAVEAMRDLQNRKVAGKVALIPDFG